MTIKSWLSQTNGFFFSLYASVAAFCTYSCMYAFRKPFVAATFHDMVFLGIDYKIWLITAQVFGYMLSKFAGIKIVSEMKGNKTAQSLVILILIAEVALLFFGLVPAPYNIIFLFINGLPLGMVWGLVFSYLEGRRYTEILGAVLCGSLIVASGIVKTVGMIVMTDWGITEFWMPFVTGSLFVLPLIFFVWMLNQLPPPTALDEDLRTKRVPMNSAERWKLFRTFAPGIIMLIIVYMMLTAYRDFRDNFMADLWNALGYGDKPMLFTSTEVPIAFGVLTIMGLIMIIRKNNIAFMINHIIIILGFALTGIATFAFESQLINAPTWIILIGMGMYMGYVPFNSILFDRLLATFQYVGTAGFMIYVADSFGYLGSVGILMYKNFWQANISWLSFFIRASYISSVVGLMLTILSMIYFERKYRKTIP